MRAEPTRPDFTGIWQLNIEKSSMRGPVPSRMLVKIEHDEPRLVQSILATRAGGRDDFVVFTFEAGREVTNGAMTTRADWNGAELVIESFLKTEDRERHFKDHWTLSSDGATLRMAHRDDDLAGQIAVLENAPPDAAEKFRTREK